MVGQRSLGQQSERLPTPFSTRSVLLAIDRKQWDIITCDVGEYLVQIRFPGVAYHLTQPPLVCVRWYRVPAAGATGTVESSTDGTGISWLGVIAKQ